MQPDTPHNIDALNFVVAPSYHGATLLAVLLNNHPNITSLGDMPPSSGEDLVCSCGELMSKCHFWCSVAATSAEKDTPFPPKQPRLITDYTANRLIGLSLALISSTTSHHIWRLTGNKANQYINSHLAFYQKVMSTHGTSIFIDGEKSLSKPLFFRGILGRQIPIRVLHLVRDPRGFYNSTKKYNQSKISDAAKQWSFHRHIQRLENPIFNIEYKRVRYEDICKTPQKTLNDIFDYFQASPADVIRKPDKGIKGHLLGNKMLHTFDGTVRLDTTWRKALPSSEQVDLFKRVEPIAKQYGYKL